MAEDYLKRLYRNGMETYVKHLGETPEYRAILSKRRDVSEKLRKEIGASQRELFGDVLEMQRDMYEITCETAFAERFRLCAGLVRELAARPVSACDADLDDEETE